MSHCPVCQARFRGARLCSRCGVDLGPLMRLAVGAWRLRDAARQALVDGNVERAHALASDAQHLHRTSRGESLRLLSGWLQGAGSEQHPPKDAQSADSARLLREAHQP